MLQIVTMKGDKDSENKKFIATLVVAGLSAIGLTAAALVSALGGNTQIDLDNIKKLR